MNARMRGFTLIELLIAMLLITLALTIAFAALRLGTRSLERTDRLADTLEELRITRIVVQRHLAQARPLLEMADGQLNFRGEAQELEFVAPAPLQAERIAGLYHYRLHIEHDAQGGQLMLDYQPYTAGPLRNWSSDHETTLLLDHLTTAAFSYYNPQPQQEEWLARWDDNERLPRLVRVTLGRSSGPEEQLEMVVMLPIERAR